MSGRVETKHEMLRADYKFLSHAKCKSCKAAIEWWLTTNKRKIPFDPMPASDRALVTCHLATCKGSMSKPDQPAAAAPKQAMQTTQELLKTLARELRSRTDAKVVVVILDNCSAASWRNGIPGEDLRQDLITEGNSIRRHIEGSQPR